MHHFEGCLEASLAELNELLEDAQTVSNGVSNYPLGSYYENEVKTILGRLESGVVGLGERLNEDGEELGIGTEEDLEAFSYYEDVIDDAVALFDSSKPLTLEDLQSIYDLLAEDY